MKLPRYEYTTEGQATVFLFTSEGPKGKVKKLVAYSEMLEKDVYNLAFGDYNEESGMIDDRTITNNEDSQKVLATVASTLYNFTEKLATFGFMRQVVIRLEQDFIKWALRQILKKFYWTSKFTV